MFGWSHASFMEDTGKLKIAITGIVIILGLIGLLWIASTLGPKSPKMTAAETTSTTSKTVNGTDTPTTTNPENIYSPESITLNADQFKARNSYSNSGLRLSEYNSVVNYASKFSAAEAMGSNMKEFDKLSVEGENMRYYDSSLAYKWMSEYKEIYAWAKKTDDPSVYKAWVAFEGVKVDGTKVEQAVRGVTILKIGNDLQVDDRPSVTARDQSMGVVIVR